MFFDTGGLIQYTSTKEKMPYIYIWAFLISFLKEVMNARTPSAQPLWAPLGALVGHGLWAMVGPYGPPCSCAAPWALAVRSGLLWAGPLWVPWALVGPPGPLGQALVGQALVGHLGPCGPGAYGLPEPLWARPLWAP